MSSKPVFQFVLMVALLFIANHASAQATLEECKKAQELAQQGCTQQGNQGMSPPQQQAAQQYNQGVQGANQNVGQAQGAMAQQCQNQADMSKFLSALSGLKAGACEKLISDCTDTCKEVEENPKSSDYDKKKAKSAAGICSALQTNALSALAQAAALFMGALQNQKCADAARTTSTSPTPLPGMDCNNPEIAKYNPICICGDGATPGRDPKNPICPQNQAAPGAVGSASSSYSPQTPRGSTDSSSSGDGQIYNGVELKAKTASGGTETPSNGGGGPQALGGSKGGSGSGGGDGGAAAPGEKPITGAGSGGGGNAGAPGPGAAAAGGGGGGSDGRAPGDKSGKIDLFALLPKSPYKNRGLAGMSVTAKDGITGPMGPSIWEKVSNQYQLQKSRMITDK